jgi:hypothetical protein
MGNLLLETPEQILSRLIEHGSVETITANSQKTY